MSHAVAEQGESALDEEDTDERGDEPDECRGDERPLHEVVAEESHQPAPGSRTPGSGARMTTSSL